MDKKLYRVFAVDITPLPYSMDVILVGAEDMDDLLNHLPEMDCMKSKDKDTINQILEFSNVHEINAWTDKPYVVIDDFAYYE